MDHILVYNFGAEPGDERYPADVAGLPGFSAGAACPSGLFFCAYESLGEVCVCVYVCVCLGAFAHFSDMYLAVGSTNPNSLTH